jgi:hypothetical protein
MTCESRCHAQLLHQARRQAQHAAQQRLVLGPDVSTGRDVLLGDDQHVHRRPGVDVVEGQQLVVLVDLLRRDLPGTILQKMQVGRHSWKVRDLLVRAGAAVRCANSSRPDSPSRRSSSASTSAGAEPEVRQRHHRVEPQVGHLVDDLLAVAVLAGHHRLGGLFADLLQDGVGALGKQRAT